MLKSIFSLLLLAFCKLIFSQEKLPVIPAVQNWEPGKTKINYQGVFIQLPVNNSNEQKDLVFLFQKELDALNIPVVKKTTLKSLDIVFIASTKNDFPEEGYEIFFGKKTKVKAKTYQGFLYATRTLLQLFSQESYRKNFPEGTIIDYPNYPKRMLMLDVARKFFSLEELKDYIRAMAWVKMNEFHLHLSDNSWGGYSAYRLESKLYPDLTAKDGYYSWKQIAELIAFAKTYGITITPEIDAPGHSQAFTAIRPDLKSPLLGDHYLDIANKETYSFIENIIGEVVPHFDAPDFHIGTDEYRINTVKNDSLKKLIGETFRKYINHMNAFVRGKGKNTRIWSGYEGMPGTTEPDKSVIIDMWETSDAKTKSAAGYQFINSSHYFSYIVPGAPYYGVDDRFIYEKWTPEVFGNKEDQNLSKGSAGLKGSKMHIWNDYGPTGYTTSEIARLSIPSMMVFSEKMWGTKGFDSLTQFIPLRNSLLKIPATTFLNNNWVKPATIFSINKPVDLHKEKIVLTNSKTGNLEYPWTLEMQLKRTSAFNGNEVIFSSSSATIYARLEQTVKDKKTKADITKKGFAIVRANQTEGKTPFTSYNPSVLIFDYQLPLDTVVVIKLTGEKEKTTLFVDGNKIGEMKVQTICPLKSIGAAAENNFSGILIKAAAYNFLKN